MDLTNIPDLVTKDPLSTKDDDFAGDLENWQSKYNLTMLNPHLIVGGEIFNRRMMDTLEQMGVDGVICVAEEDCAETQRRTKKCGVKAFLAMLPDTMANPIPDVGDLLAIWDWYEDLYRKALFKDKCFPTVYVHCHAGLHRGPAVAALLLAKLCCTSFEDALSYVYARRPFIEVSDRPGLMGACKDALRRMGGKG